MSEINKDREVIFTAQKDNCIAIPIILIDFQKLAKLHSKLSSNVSKRIFPGLDKIGGCFQQKMKQN